MLSQLTLNGLAILCFLSMTCVAQLSFHTDANTNSFTLKTPELQQSFTRYYGGQGGNLQQQQQQQVQQQQQQQYQQPQYQQPQLQQPQQQQQQPQYTPLNSPYQQQPQYAQQQPISQYSSAPGQFASNYAGITSQAAQHAQILQQLQAAQQQMQQAAQPTPQAMVPYNNAANYYAYQNQQQDQAYVQQQQQQQQQQQDQEAYGDQQKQLLKQLYDSHPRSQQGTSSSPVSHISGSQGNQYLTADQYMAYLAKQSHHVLNDQQNRVQQQYQQSNYANANPTQATYSMPYSTGESMHDTSSPANGSRNGLDYKYSPSNKVSHVKFQSGNLAYNF